MLRPPPNGLLCWSLMLGLGCVEGVDGQTQINNWLLLSIVQQVKFVSHDHEQTSIVPGARGEHGMVFRCWSIYLSWLFTVCVGHHLNSNRPTNQPTDSLTIGATQQTHGRHHHTNNTYVLQLGQQLFANLFAFHVKKHWTFLLALHASVLCVRLFQFVLLIPWTCMPSAKPPSSTRTSFVYPF